MTGWFRYFKRHWDEPRGDEHDDWGTSDWYFEVGDDGFPVRQIEAYTNGPVMKYDQHRPEDEYGGLGQAALDFDDFAPFEISADDFERAWASLARRTDHI